MGSQATRNTPPPEPSADFDRRYFPKNWDEFIGQEAVKFQLRTAARSAAIRGETMEHVLLASPIPGCGKTSLAMLAAEEIGGDCKILAEVVKPNQVGLLFSFLKDGDVLFIDEALDLDTPLPTPDGWVRLRDLRVGDQLFGSNGQPVTVKRLTPIKTDAVCYRVTFADGTSLVADAGHKWLVAPRVKSGSRYLAERVLTTQEMADDAVRTYRVPMPAPVELPPADLPLDPYALGQWLGNGNQGQPYINVRWDLADEALEAIPGSSVLGWSAISRGSIIRLSLGEEGKTALRELGILDGKGMPARYLRGSIEQRLALLQGLMDTDGHVSSGGYCTFTNTNESIVNGTVELLRSLGYTAYKHMLTEPRLNAAGEPYKPCWKVHFKGEPDMPPFRLRGIDFLSARKHSRHKLIVSIERVESRAVRCIEVDSEDHLFLAGDGFTVTHNCHRLVQGGKQNAEWLLKYMDEGVIATPLGMEPAPKVTIIAATTDMGRLPPTILSRFDHKPELTPYTEEEGQAIAIQLGRKVLVDYGVSLPTPAAAQAIARAASCSPRAMRNILIAVRDLVITEEIEDNGGNFDLTLAFKFAGVTADGLSAGAQRYLLALLNEHKGNPAGRSTLAESIGEVGTGIAEIEKLLMSKNLIAKLKTGRTLTMDGIRRAKELAA